MQHAAALSAHSTPRDRSGDDHSSSEQDRLETELHTARDCAEERQRERARLVHDARNACAGIRASVEMVADHCRELDPTALDRLRELALFGLAHLEELIDRTDPSPTGFAVAEVVDHVVGGRRLLGSGAVVLAADVVSAGRPGDLATALLNVLVNCERHAPGAPVTVEISRRAAEVRICVTDCGPGLEPGCEEVVFGRGWRGPASSGEGWGLYSARQLMRGLGGDLRVIPSAYGAAFMLTLPASVGGVDAADRHARGLLTEQVASR